MKTTERFETAVKALYTAFHNNELNAFDCSACAVGNIVGHGQWVTTAGSYKPKTIYFPHHFATRTGGYTPTELGKVEWLFLQPFKEILLSNDMKNAGRNKDAQFKGLCEVVKYLAELDNIPNPMDYSALFETNKQGEAKLQLEEVFV